MARNKPSELKTETEEIAETTSEMAIVTHAEEIPAEITEQAKTPAADLGTGLSKAIYSGFYYLSYGAVFGALMIAKLAPTDNIMGKGLKDGAEAAKAAFHKRQEEQAPDEAQEGLLTA